MKFPNWHLYLLHNICIQQTNTSLTFVNIRWCDKGHNPILTKEEFVFKENFSFMAWEMYLSFPVEIFCLQLLTYVWASERRVQKKWKGCVSSCFIKLMLLEMKHVVIIWWIFWTMKIATIKYFWMIIWFTTNIPFTTYDTSTMW